MTCPFLTRQFDFHHQWPHQSSLRQRSNRPPRRELDSGRRRWAERVESEWRFHSRVHGHGGTLRCGSNSRTANNWPR